MTPLWSTLSPETLYEVLQGLWLVLIAALGFWVWQGLQVGRQWRLALGLVGLVAAGVVLRLLLAPNGPGDYRCTLQYLAPGQSTSGLTGRAAETFLWMLPSHDDGPLLARKVNLILGSLAPAILVLLVRELRFKNLAAWLAGAALTLHPLAVRFAGVENRATFVLFLQAVTLLALVRYWYRGDLVALLAFLAGGFLLMDTRPETVRIVPESTFLLVALFWVSWRDGTVPVWRRVVGPVTALAVMSGAIIYTLATKGLEPLYGKPWGGVYAYIDPARNIFFDPHYTPVVAIALCVLGLALVVRRPNRVLLGVIAALALSHITTLAYSSSDQDLASTRYQMNALLYSSIFVGLGAATLLQWLAPRRLALTRLALALLAGLAIWSTAATMRHIVAPRTIDQEYEFLRRVVSLLPPDAEIYEAPTVHRDSQLRRFEFLSHAAGAPQQSWLTWPPAGPTTERPRFYLHRAWCSLSREYNAPMSAFKRQLQDRCWQLRDRYATGRIWEEELVGRRHSTDYYRTDTVPVGVYEMPADEYIPLAKPSAPDWARTPATQP